MCAFKYADIINIQSQFSGNYLSKKKGMAYLYYKAKCVRVSKKAMGMPRHRKRWLLLQSGKNLGENFWEKVLNASLKD